MIFNFKRARSANFLGRWKLAQICLFFPVCLSYRLAANMVRAFHACLPEHTRKQATESLKQCKQRCQRVGRKLHLNTCPTASPCKQAQTFQNIKDQLHHPKENKTFRRFRTGSTRSCKFVTTVPTTGFHRRDRATHKAPRSYLELTRSHHCNQTNICMQKMVWFRSGTGAYECLARDRCYLGQQRTLTGALN